MLWTIFVILLVLWLLGLVSSYTLGGFIQMGLLWMSARRAGISLQLRRPRYTPGVRQFELWDLAPEEVRK